MASSEKRLRHALVIEDERSDRDLIVKILTREAFEVDSVISGREALEKIQDQQYDLISLDMVLPEMDGFDFLKEVSRLRPELMARVVIVSKLFVDDVKRVFPVCHIVQKPFIMEELVRLARTCAANE
jgi:DNA-binding response OmpR family regulator